MDTLHSFVRKMVGREESPSMGIIDSRSVKMSHHVDSDRGIDGNKKVKGRKEHIVVDTHGLQKDMALHEANLYVSEGAPKVIVKLECTSSQKILADGGYQGSLGTGWLRSSDGALKPCFFLMNVSVSSKSSRNDGLSKDPSPG